MRRTWLAEAACERSRSIGGGVRRRLSPRCRHRWKRVVRRRLLRLCAESHSRGLEVAGCGDRLETRVDAERLKDPADVVSDGLRAQVQLGRDLLGGAPLLQKWQHLDLAGREMRGWRRARVGG